MQGILLAVLYPLRWLAHELDDDAPAPSAASLRLPGARRDA